LKIVDDLLHCDESHGRLTRQWARWLCFHRKYHALIYLSVVAWLGELAYGIMNQSAIQPYVKYIHLESSLGLIFATFLVVETAFKSPMGHLGDRLGRKPLIVGGAIISCITALLTSITSKLLPLLMLRACDGLACAAIWPTLMAAVGGSVEPEERTTAMSVVTFTYIAGVSFGPFLGGLANDLTGSKKASLYLVSAMFVVTAVVAFFLTPRRTKEDIKLEKSGEEHHISVSDILLGLKTIPDMMILAFMTFFAIGLLIPIVKFFGMDELGLSETGYGSLILPIAAAVGLASLGAGRLGDLWGKAKSVKAGLALAVIAMWGISFSKVVWQFGLAGMILGAGFVLAMPAWLALVSDIAAPRVRGAVIGALGTAQGIGAVIGAILGPKLYAGEAYTFHRVTLDPHYVPFFLSASSLTVALIVVAFSVRDHDSRRIG
jgi:MFS family permease